MPNKQVLGLFEDAERAAQATDRLNDAGFGAESWEVLTGCPYSFDTILFALTCALPVAQVPLSGRGGPHPT